MKKTVLFAILFVVFAALVFAGCNQKVKLGDIKEEMDRLNSFTVSLSYAYGKSKESAEPMHLYSTTKVWAKGDEPGSETTLHMNSDSKIYEIRGASFSIREGIVSGNFITAAPQKKLTISNPQDIVFEDIPYAAKINKGIIEYRFSMTDDFVKQIIQNSASTWIQVTPGTYELIMKADKRTKRINEVVFELNFTSEEETFYILTKVEYSDFNTTSIEYPAAIFDVFTTKEEFLTLAEGLSSIPTYKATGSYTYREDSSSGGTTVAVNTGFTRTETGGEYSRLESRNNTHYLTYYKDGKRYRYENDILLEAFEQQTIEDAALFSPDVSKYVIKSIRRVEEPSNLKNYYIEFVTPEESPLKILLPALGKVFETTGFYLTLSFEKDSGKLKKLYFYPASLFSENDIRLSIDLTFTYDNGGVEIPDTDPSQNAYSYVTAALDRFADETDFYSLISVKKDGNTFKEASGFYHRGDTSAPLFAMFTVPNAAPDGYYYYNGQETVYKDGFLYHSGAASDIDADYAALDFLTVLTKTQPSNIHITSYLLFELFYPEGTMMEEWTKTRLGLTGDLTLVSASVELFALSEVPRFVQLVYQEGSNTYHVDITYLYGGVPVDFYLPAHIRCGFTKSQDESGNAVYATDYGQIILYEEGRTLAVVNDIDSSVITYSADTLQVLYNFSPFDEIKDVQLNGYILSFVATGVAYGVNVPFQIDMRYGRPIE